MKSRLFWLSVPALLASAPGCTAKPASEIVVVVQTDLSLPKDIDTIQMQIFSNGVKRYDVAHGVPGDGTTSILLPATLGLVAGEDQNVPVTIRVNGRQSGPAGNVRVLREVVTTVPVDRIATLQVPLHFLCDGSGKAKANPDTGQMTDVESANCAEGLTCVAGSCVSSTVDSSTLPDYEAEDVFGGGSGNGDGTCFDVAACFEVNQAVTLDMTTCSFPANGTVNVGLSTEGDGICGAGGCFVALDAESEAGFISSAGQVKLPIAVCTQIAEGKILGVVTAAVSSTCGQKTVRTPTCGPWSSVGSGGSGTQSKVPTALAAGQDHPVSLTLSENRVYWTNGGTFGAADGAVKSVFVEGGTPAQIATLQASPRDVVLDASSVYWTNADTSGGSGGAIMKAALGTSDATPIVSSLSLPEGVTVASSGVYWTEFSTGNVMKASLSGASPVLLAPGNYPYRIAADKSAVYWTNEGTAASMPPDGNIVRYDLSQGPGGVPDVIAAAEGTPRALVLDAAEGEDATAVFWASFADGGEIVSMSLTAGAPGARTVLATGQSYPNGIAVDAANVYWTSRGDGTVKSLSRTAAAGTAPTTIASGQIKPAAIVVDDVAIYWVNEGGSSSKNGSVMRLLK